VFRLETVKPEFAARSSRQQPVYRQAGPPTFVFIFLADWYRLNCRLIERSTNSPTTSIYRKIEQWSFGNSNH
jgi:hypothetical protein